LNPKPHSALVILGHGSKLTAESAAPTLRHAATLRARRVFAEVHAAFWKVEPFLQPVLDAVQSREIYLVPNFISEGYFTRVAIPKALGLTGPETRLSGSRRLRYCPPVGNHPEMTAALLGRAAEVAPGVAPETVSLVIAAHGTPRDGRSGEAARREAARIAARGRYAEVIAAYLEEPPQIADWAAVTRQPVVVVVPFFISDGLHGAADIPKLLGLPPGVTGGGPWPVNGRQLYYARAIGTDPLFADLILDQVDAFDRQHGFTP